MFGPNKYLFESNKFFGTNKFLHSYIVKDKKNFQRNFVFIIINICDQTDL